MQKGPSKVKCLDQFSCHWRHGLDYVGVQRRFKRDRKNDAFLVSKTIVQLLIKSTIGAQRTDTRRKTVPRLVYLDEGRDPVEAECGGDEGLKLDETPKPPQPRGLLGLCCFYFYFVAFVIMFFLLISITQYMILIHFWMIH